MVLLSHGDLSMTTVFDRLVALLEDEAAGFRVIEHPAEGRSDLVAEVRGTVPGQGAKAMLCKSKDDDCTLVLAILPGDRTLQPAAHVPAAVARLPGKRYAGSSPRSSVTREIWPALEKLISRDGPASRSRTVTS